MKTPPIAALLMMLFLCAGSVLGQHQEQEVIRSRIKRSAVQSSNVASVGYSRELRALEIEFVRGAVYRFLEVPPNLHRRLLAAESKGRFIAENLRGKYQFVRVRPRRGAPRSEPRLEAQTR